MWDGVEVNHQFSKGLRAERLLSAALAQGAPELRCSRSCAPPRSWRSRARSRAWSATTARSRAATRCSASTRRCARASWCCDCPKCRFVFLALAPFSEPAHLREVFGRDLLDDERQFEGFALLTATGGHKPFECVGEEQESLAAIRLLARDERWSGHSVVRRLVAEVLPRFPADAGDPDAVLALSDEHARASGAAGGGPCGSRSLTARASACGAPAARSPRSPISSRAGCRRRGSSWRPSTRRPPRDVRETLRAPDARIVRIGGDCRRGAGGGAAPAARWSCARPACRSTGRSCSAVRAAGTPVTTPPRCGWPSTAVRA